MRGIHRCSLLILLFTALSMINAQEAPYKLATKFLLGGEGGWDYITFDSSSNRLLIGHNKEILIIDSGTGAKLGSVPAQGAHGAVIVPGQNLGFSSNGASGTVTVFDAKTYKPKQQIKVGDDPDTIIYDAYAKKVVVLNGRSNDLMVIDPESLKVESTLKLGGSPEFATSDPSHLFINMPESAEIAVVSTKTWQIDRRWKLANCDEPTGMAIDENAHHLFSVCRNKKMVIVNSDNGTVVTSVDTGAGTDGAGFDPDLGYAFASNGRDGTLTVVRSKAGSYEVAAQVHTQLGARTMALDPKSHRIFLPTAEYLPPAPGQTRPSIKPGTFTVLVFEPTK